MQYVLVIRLARIKLNLENNTKSAFAYRTAIINPVAVAKFSHLICDVVFISLFAISQLERGLQGPITNYFVTIETNSHGILHLHCLIWWKSVLHLVTLCSQIQNNYEFNQKLFLFLEYVIKYSISRSPPGNVTSCISGCQWLYKHHIVVGPT